MLDEDIRGARSRGEPKRGTSARLATLVAALVLAIGSCGLADPETKSRTDSMRGASWPGADANEGASGSVAVVHTATPSPEPTASASSFYGAFESSDGAQNADDGPPQGPDRTLWPLPTPDDPEYEELGHSPEPDPETDPCDAVGVLPDECDPDPEPEPEPEPSPCDDSAATCEPPDCEDPDGCGPPDCDGSGEPTSQPTAQEGGSGSSGDGDQSPTPTGTPDPTQTPGATPSPDPTPSSDPTPSPSPSDPPDDGDPGC